MIQSKGVVVLSAFSRDVLLDQCLESIYSADHSSSIRKLITHQSGYPEVSKIILKYEDAMTSILRVDGLGRTKLQNINLNYWNGFSVAFGTYKADWVLCVEEDSMLSSDVFTFIDYIYTLYKQKFFFRGINLGSIQNDPSLNGTYSRLRYGFHGSAGVITAKSWRNLRIIRTGSKLNSFPFDSATEKYWRTGFMVTPNITKTVNFGWIGGTHTNPEPNQPHFLKIRESWEIRSESPIYSEKNIAHEWGGSSETFIDSSQIKSLLVFLLSFILDRRVIFTLKYRMRVFKRKLLRQEDLPN